MKVQRSLSLSRTALPTGALVALLLGASAVAGLQIEALHRQSTERADRGKLVHAVRTEVLDLVNIEASTTDAQVQALLGGMTSAMRKTFTGQASAFRHAMVQNKVKATGRVLAIGLEKVEGNRATAIVAATALVSNSHAVGAQDRNYRLRLGMTKVGERWLVNSMVFVS